MGVDELRGLSSVLFGSRYRLELVAALALVNSDEGVCLTRLARLARRFAGQRVLPVGPVAGRRGPSPAGAPGRPGTAGAVRPPAGPAWKGLRRMMEDLEVDISLRDVARPAGEPS